MSKMAGLEKPETIHNGEALEAIDFIVMVLKEHEKDLDRLINELGNITERLSNIEAKRFEEVKNG